MREACPSWVVGGRPAGVGEEAWEAIRRGNVVRPGRRENEYGRGDGMGDGRVREKGTGL